MSEFSRLLAHVGRQFAGAILTFVLWMTWFALVVVAVAQLYILSRQQLNVPDFVLRRLETKLEQAGLKATFERATFDPTGRILVESPRVFLPGYADAVVTARAAYVGLSPWEALVGRFEAREIRVVDATVLVPSMLSPSGRAEPIVRNIDAFVVPGDREFALRHVSARVSGLQVSAHGSVILPRGPSRPPELLAQTIHARFAEFCRGAVEFTRRLEAFEQPSLELVLTPSTTRGALVSADLVARGFKLDAPFVAEFGQLRARTRFPLLGDAPATSRLDLTTDELRLPGGIEVQRLAASIRGRLQPAELRVRPVELDVEADKVTTPDGIAEAVSGVARPKGMPRWQGEVVGRALGSAVDVRGEVDLTARTANVHLVGAISPAVLDLVSRRAKRDIRPFFDFEALDCQRADAIFGPGWKFEKLAARVALRGIKAHGVAMDSGFATLELDPHHLYAPDAFARIGANFARGSYEHDFATHEFRFLLNGQLRPLDIGEWFHPWWENFFRRFEFPVAPPVASVDVHGFWRDGRQTSVFVFADANAPVIMGQKLKRVRTRLFIRPGFYDGLEMFGVDPQGGTAKGTFAVSANVDSGNWRSIDFEGTTNIALDVGIGLGGELAKPLLAPFETAGVPAVVGRGHFDGPDVSGPRHEQLDLDVRSAGPFRFYRLPFEDVAFTLKLRDDEMTVDANEAKFAGGTAKAHVKVWGEGAGRRIGFDAMLNDARLGEAVVALQRFNAERKGQPVPPAGKFVQEKANVRVDIAASADGMYGNALSFHGGGNASLRGAEIGEVPLFGPLSELLKFTALRFTTAVTRFKINGPKVEFPEFAVRGANSAIDAHGEYAVDRRQLDFRAKVFPFQESGSVIKSVVGAVLTPISNVLEVKLTGTLEQPDWAFVIGPTNLFRSLAPGEQPATGTTDAAAKPPAKGVEPAAPAPQPVRPAPKAD